MRKQEREVAERVARMLETAGAESDYRRKWARVNRAAGMIAVAAASGEMDVRKAGTRAQMITDKALDSCRIADRPMLTRGLQQRVGRALYEWYTGSCPEEI